MSKFIFWQGFLKKNGIIFLVLFLFFAVFFAITQETPLFQPKTSSDQEGKTNESSSGETELNNSTFAKEKPEWIQPARWFRSNAGGMALQEIPSRLAALRNKYALVIDYTDSQELPEHLLPFYNDEFFIEVRRLFEDGKESRVQWLFKDFSGLTRLIAVFTEIEVEAETNNESSEENSLAGGGEDTEVNIEDAEEKFDTEITEGEYTEINEAENTEGSIIVENITGDETSEQLTEDESTENIENENTDVEFADAEENNLKEKILIGFIEIFDESGFITSEYKYNEDKQIEKIIYNYKDGIIISAAVFLWEENETTADEEIEEPSFQEMYKDHYRYNRSLFLRGIERVFSQDQQITIAGEPVKISFPSNIMNAARNDYFLAERLNSYPEFFGDLFVRKNSRMEFTTDERGRILTQTLYDENAASQASENPQPADSQTPEDAQSSDLQSDTKNSIIWQIVNIWQDDRIISMKKTEGETTFLAEFEFDSDGNRVLEKNFKNGVLERLVRTEGNTEIEELYLNGVIIMEAVWEDGRLISEERINN